MKLSDKLAQIEEAITVKLYDNGYVVEANGVDAAEDWASSKILCDTLADVFVLITEAATMKRR